MNQLSGKKSFLNMRRDYISIMKSFLEIGNVFHDSGCDVSFNYVLLYA